jgi:transcriptional regulator with XRE-family HTH domain
MLADTAGVSKQAISKFENGELNPSNRMFKLLCEIFKIHPTFFTQRNLKIQFKDNKIIVLNESRITIAKMRDLEKQVLSGEISYSRMVEIINETLFTTS